MVMCCSSGIFMLLLATLAAVESTRHDSSESKTLLEASGSLDLQDQIQNDASAVTGLTNSELHVAAYDKTPPRAEDKRASRLVPLLAALGMAAAMPEHASAGLVTEGGKEHVPQHLQHLPAEHHMSLYNDYPNFDDLWAESANPGFDDLWVESGNKDGPWNKQGAKVPTMTDHKMDGKVNHKMDGKVAVKNMEGEAGKRVYVPRDGRSWSIETIKEEALKQQQKCMSEQTVLVEMAGRDVQEKHLSDGNFPAFIKMWRAPSSRPGQPHQAKLLVDLSYNNLGGKAVWDLLKAVAMNPEAIQHIDLRYTSKESFTDSGERSREKDQWIANRMLAQDINNAAGYQQVILTNEDAKVAEAEKVQRVALRDGVKVPERLQHIPAEHRISHYGDYTIAVDELDFFTKDYQRHAWDKEGVEIPTKTNHKKDKQVDVEMMEGGVVKRVYVPVDGRSRDIETIKKEASEQLEKPSSEKFVLVEMAGLAVRDYELEGSKFPAFIEKWGEPRPLQAHPAKKLFDDQGYKLLGDEALHERLKTAERNLQAERDQRPHSAKQLLVDLSYNQIGGKAVHELLKAVEKNPQAIQEIDLRYTSKEFYPYSQQSYPEEDRLSKKLAQEINDAAGYRKVILTSEDREAADRQKVQRLEKQLAKVTDRQDAALLKEQIAQVTK